MREEVEKMSSERTFLLLLSALFCLHVLLLSDLFAETIERRRRRREDGKDDQEAVDRRVEASASLYRLISSSALATIIICLTGRIRSLD